MREPSLFEAIYTARAIRKFSEDPVTDEELMKVLEAGTMAPSPGNCQPWEFIILKDTESKKRLQSFYEKSFDELLEDFRKKAEEDKGLREALKSLEKLRKSFAAKLYKIPILILVCVNLKRIGISLENPKKAWALSTIYGGIFPCIQNMLLAARGLGLGSVLTNMHCNYEEDVKSAFGIPDYCVTVALLPLGRPRTRFGRVKRRPAREFVHLGRWGVKG